MPFDPSKPVENTPLDAAEMRNQLNGLADQIATKASNCDSVDQLNIAFHDPVTRAEAEAIQAKLNEVIATMHT